jgi:DNA mismatch endonuclease (patch repair protein)
MTDKHSTEKRSYNMSRIKGKNTKPELLVRKFLFAHGFRFRLHSKNLPGKPDIVLTKYKTVILIHGCFWHRHEGCKYAALPKTNTEFWIPKLQYNRQNDIRVNEALKHEKWNIIEIWTCELKKDKIQNTLGRLPVLINRS